MSNKKVFLYVPNLIGYARVITLLIGIYASMFSPIFFLLNYTISFLLDAADGWAARKYNQSSKFGAVLDMVTDRTGTMALVIILSHLYSRYTFGFILLCILDFMSHWFRMYSSILNSSHHKELNPDHFWLLNIYYGNRTILGAVCLMNEFFYIFVYIIHFFTLFPLFYIGSYSIDIFKLGALICFPIFSLKQILNVFQLYHSSLDIIEFEFPSDSKKKKMIL
eukprot:TRINITY_DN5234_c0_g1_i1.p1 TRINITY_DN5234_c0_g1~~TRINITY_DN5234_c0_g1_i1.p1  ORF type:complete len:222 (+),score=27.06 TRINITY_DN5234_c0_g1_i1:90-755(+)